MFAQLCIRGLRLEVLLSNIGDRQLGRLRAENVIDANSDCGEIERAIERALNPSLKQELGEAKNPYGDGETGGRIVQVL